MEILACTDEAGRGGEYTQRKRQLGTTEGELGGCFYLLKLHARMPPREEIDACEFIVVLSTLIFFIKLNNHSSSNNYIQIPFMVRSQSQLSTDVGSGSGSVIMNLHKSHAHTRSGL